MERQHKFVRLFYTRAGGVFDGLKICVDIVPCLAFDYETQFKATVNQNGRFHIVPKAPVELDNSLPISYNNFENWVLSSGPEWIRDGYTLAKALRCKLLSDVCHPRVGHGVNFEPEEAITSYMLKSCTMSLFLSDDVMLAFRMSDKYEDGFRIRTNRVKTMFARLGKFAKGQNQKSWIDLHVFINVEFFD